MTNRITREHLWETDPADLEFILSYEFGGHDAVLWRAFNENDPNGENYFHHLIIEGKSEHLSKLHPPVDFAKQARAHKTDGHNFIHLASIHVKNTELLSELTPFLETAFLQDPTLLFEKNTADSTPLSVAISHNNELMVDCFLGFILKYHDQFSPAQFCELFTGNQPCADSSVFELAKSIPGISNDIISKLQNHGAHLFSKITAIQNDAESGFSSPEAFKKAVIGEGASTALVLPGTKEYWINCLRSLQFRHRGTFMSLTKYASLEMVLTGKDIIPSAKEDLEVIKQLLFIQRSNALILRDLMSKYDSHNPIKTLTKKIIHLDQENPQLAIDISRRVNAILILMELSVLICYVLYVNNLYELACDIRTHLKKTYPECLDKEYSETYRYSLYICDTSINNWFCNNKTEPWYEEYHDDYKQCQQAFSVYYNATYGGVPLYMLSAMVFLMIPFLFISPREFHLEQYPMIAYPFRIFNTLFGKHNPETISYDKSSAVNGLKKAFELFLPLFEGDEKSAIEKILQDLSATPSEIKLKQIIDYGESLALILGQYASHVNHLPLRSRVAIKDLIELKKVLGGDPEPTVSNVPRAPLLTQFKLSMPKSNALTINEDIDIENEGTSLLKKPKQKTRCTII